MARNTEKVNRDYSYLLLTAGYAGSAISTIWSGNFRNQILSITSFILMIAYYNYQQRKKYDIARREYFIHLNPDYRDMQNISELLNSDNMFLIGETGITADKFRRNGQMIRSTIPLIINTILWGMKIITVSVWSTLLIIIGVASLVSSLSQLNRLYTNTPSPVTHNLLTQVCFRSQEILIIFTYLNIFNMELLGLLATALYGLFNHFYFDYKFKIFANKISATIKEQNQARREEKVHHSEQKQEEVSLTNIANQISKYTWGVVNSTAAFFSSPDDVEPEQPNLWRDWLPQW